MTQSDRMQALASAFHDEMEKLALWPILAGAARVLPFLGRAGAAMGGVKGIGGMVGTNMAMNVASNALGGMGKSKVQRPAGQPAPVPQTNLAGPRSQPAVSF